jgi:ribosomal protein L37AE/L43A
MKAPPLAKASWICKKCGKRFGTMGKKPSILDGGKCKSKFGGTHTWIKE